MKFYLHLFLMVVLCGASLQASAQTKNSSYQTVAHIKSDGTMQDGSYRAIVHADGIPMKMDPFFA